MPEQVHADERQVAQGLRGLLDEAHDPVALEHGHAEVLGLGHAGQQDVRIGLPRARTPPRTASRRRGARCRRGRAGTDRRSGTTAAVITACAMPSGASCAMNVISMPQRDPSPTAARTSSPVAPVTMPTSRIPASAIASSAWNRIGVPATGISCFAFVEVIGRSREPSPPESTSARIRPRARDTRSAGRRCRPGAGSYAASMKTTTSSGRPFTCRSSSVGKYFCDDLRLGIGVGRVGDHAAGHLLLVRREGAHARRDVEAGLREHVLDLGDPAVRRVIDDEHRHVGLRGRRVRRGHGRCSPSGSPSRIAAKMRSAESSMRRMPRFAGSGIGRHGAELGRAGRDAFELADEERRGPRGSGPRRARGSA